MEIQAEWKAEDLIGTSKACSNKENRKKNMVVVYLQQQQVGFILRYDPYMMKVNYGRNYYSCGSFCHIARNYRNQRILVQGERLEYENN